MKNPFKNIEEVVQAIEHEFKYEPIDVLWGVAHEAFEMLEEAENQDSNPLLVEQDFCDLTGVEIEAYSKKVVENFETSVTRKQKLSLMSDNGLNGFIPDDRFSFTVSDSLGDCDYISCDDYAMSGGIDKG